MFQHFTTPEDRTRHAAEEETALRAYRALARGKGRVYRESSAGTFNWIARTNWHVTIGRFASEVDALRALVHGDSREHSRWSGRS